VPGGPALGTPRGFPVSTIARWQAPLRTRAGAARWRVTRCSQRRDHLARDLTDWVLHQTPRAFGFWRVPLVCAVLVLCCGSSVASAPVGKRCAAGCTRPTWYGRRPRPVLQRCDPDHQANGCVAHLVADLPDDETVVFEDEVT